MDDKQAAMIISEIRNTPGISWSCDAIIAFDHAIKALEAIDRINSLNELLKDEEDEEDNNG